MARSEEFERNIRNFAHVFERSVRLLEAHLAGERPTGPDRALRDGLIARLEAQAHLARGQMGLARYQRAAGALEAAEEALRLAEKAQVAALIYASAARKANRERSGGVLSARVEDKVLRLQRRVLADPAAPERLQELRRHLEQAEGRGWRRLDGGGRLITFIGATWCPDTVNVVEIMTVFGVPMHLLIMDEDNAAAPGVLRYNDHALFLIRPDPDRARLRVPVLIFPDGRRLIEPKPREYAIELVRQGII